MDSVVLIFPHQLFKDHSALKNNSVIYLIEAYLFFNHYKFHKQKIAFHRASMKAYEAYLISKEYNVRYIEATDPLSDIRLLIPQLVKEGIKTLHVTDPTDNWLEKRIKEAGKELKIFWYENPLFINTKQELGSFFKPSKKKFFQTSFYKTQRQQRNILMQSGMPVGGKWTYDTENRKKFPKHKTPPVIQFPDETNHHIEARTYVYKNFDAHYGELNSNTLYPIDHDSASLWLDDFLAHRFYDFGIYEDAIVKHEQYLNHSVLSPLINTGLLDPKEVIHRAISYAKANDIPLNSTEGFVRQILGWREFIRGIYEVKGSEERTKNFWGFTRKIPQSFYTGNTGIEPVDDVIKNVLKTGYAHHIERLMILGNFMMLCEFDPNDVYQWFMELFIDAYDWVMVPNVYGMSLYADGGLMSTKPYISSSNYIKKMSNYPNGNWQNIWDGLFWTFMDKHRDFFLGNPRLGMLIRTFDKMQQSTKTDHLNHAKTFLEQL